MNGRFRGQDLPDLHAGLLTVAGFDATSAAAGLGAVSVIGGVTGLVVLPAVVLGASAAGSTIDPSLIRAMWAGAAVLLILLGAIVVAFVRDRPWHLIASVIARFQRRLRRKVDARQLTRALLHERDQIQSHLKEAQAELVDDV